MAVTLDEFNHPSWFSALGTVVGYALILAVITVVLFIVPWILFGAL